VQALKDARRRVWDKAGCSKATLDRLYVEDLLAYAWVDVKELLLVNVKDSLARELSNLMTVR
jgi:hypothetical protein